MTDGAVKASHSRASCCLPGNMYVTDRVCLVTENGEISFYVRNLQWIVHAKRDVLF